MTQGRVGSALMSLLFSRKTLTACSRGSAKRGDMVSAPLHDQMAEASGGQAAQFRNMEDKGLPALPVGFF